MANSYHDLKARPPAPDKLYDTTSGADLMTRLRMSFAKPEFKRAVLEKKYGAENVGVINDKSNRNHGKIVVKDGDNILLADEEVFSLKDFVDGLGQAPELAGQIIGGVGGFLLGNVAGGAGGAMAGGPVGELGRQGIEHLLGVPNPPGIDYDEITHARNRGLVGEVTGAGLARVAQKAVSPFKRSMTPEAAALKAEADAVNMPYTGGDITKHRGVNIVESTLDKMIGSAGQFQRKRAAQLQRTGELSNELLSTTGGSVDKTQAGLAAQDSLANVTKSFKDKAKTLYDEVERLSVGETIETPNLLNAINLLKSQNKFNLLPGTVKTALKNIESKLVKEEVINGTKLRIAQPQGYADLRILRSDLGKKGAAKASIDEKAEGAFKLLRKSLEKDVEKWGQKQSIEGLPSWKKTEPWDNLRDKEFQQKSQISQAMKQADDFYKLGDEILPSIKDLKGQLGKKIFNTQRPEEIVKYIFKPNNFTNIVKTRKLVGEEGFQTLKQAFLTDLLEGAEGRFTTQGNIEIAFPRLSKIDKFFKDYDLKTLKVIFGDETLGKLNQLRRMASLSKTAQTMAGNPSGTGQIVLAGQSIQDLFRVGQGGAAVAGGGALGPMGAIAPFAGPWALAKTILSKPAVKYITKGTTMPKPIDALINASGIVGGRGLMGYEKGVK